MSEKASIRPRLLAASIASALGFSGSIATPAFAQPANDPALEEIVVTGSLIRRRDFEANSPIVTVDQDLFDQTSTSAIESQLNRLPQFTPTLDNPTQGGDIQPNARNTPGAATVALRGLGPNRSLVLINGRRGTPANASMVVDINTIPAAAVQRVEAISGGASATYGADAVAGAVNFIMRDNFEGFDLSVQTGATEEGDNFEYQVSGIMGSDIAGGRGNVSVAFSTNKREEAFQRDRKWYRDLWADPTIGGTGFFPDFSGVFIGTSNLPDPDVLNSVIDGASFTSAPSGVVFYADRDGNAFSGFDVPGVPGASGAEFIDGQKYALLANGTIGVNNTDNYLILPLRRHNMFAQGNYDITDSVSAFAEAYFSRTRTHTQQEPAPITGGWGVLIDPTSHRDAIPDELLAILDSRADDPNAPFELRTLLPFNRESSTEVSTYNLTFGFEGDFFGSDWTWEVFTSQGEAETAVLQEGFASLERVRAIMTQPNFGRGFEATGNPAFGGFGGATATCESGLNPFAWHTVTQDCFDAIRANIATKQVMKQSVWQANFQGPVATLPAGQMFAAVGANYRENEYRFQNDTLVTQGTSFLDQALGLYPSGDSAGAIDVTEGYVEFLVPVLSGLPAVQQLDFELGARWSDYNTTGSSNTYKIMADWRVNDTVRVRAGFNRAERAPNIAELFLAAEQTFGAAMGGDVCSVRNGMPWSANPERNANWRDVVRLCGQLMEASGAADADERYYGISADDVASANPADVAAGTVTTNTQAGPGPAFIFPTTAGNPNLQPEEADTWTLGTVVNLGRGSGIFSDVSFSIDYYNIEVTNAIGEQSADIVMRQCVDAAFNPTFDPNSPFCAGFGRNQDGQLGNIQRTFFNNGRFETSGIDLQLNWNFDLGPGRFGVASLVNVLLDMESAELPTDPLVDYKGTFGPSQNGLNGSSYDYRALTSFTYLMERLEFSLRWQHLPSIKSANAAIDPDTPITGAPAYNLFDLLGRYHVADNVSLRFGIENVFNERPPLTGRDLSAMGTNLPGGAFNTNNYDINGRRAYFGATINF